MCGARMSAGSGVAARRLVGAASSPAAAGSSAICVGISPGEHGGVGAGAARPFQKIKVGGGLTQSTLLQSFFVGKGEGGVDDGNGGGSGDGNNGRICTSGPVYIRWSCTAGSEF